MIVGRIATTRVKGVMRARVMMMTEKRKAIWISQCVLFSFFAIDD